MSGNKIKYASWSKVVMKIMIKEVTERRRRRKKAL